VVKVLDEHILHQFQVVDPQDRRADEEPAIDVVLPESLVVRPSEVQKVTFAEENLLPRQKDKQRSGPTAVKDIRTVWLLQLYFFYSCHRYSSSQGRTFVIGVTAVVGIIAGMRVTVVMCFMAVNDVTAVVDIKTGKGVKAVMGVAAVVNVKT
jgi:hypothetical protein